MVQVVNLPVMVPVRNQLNLKDIHLAFVVAVREIGRSAADDVLARVAISMQLGGALGNLIDRLNQGHVTDFISVGRFPVLNIADACVTVGVSLLLLSIIIQEQKTTRLSKTTAQTEQVESETEVNDEHQAD